MARMINVDDLWVFSIVAEALSLRKASEILHISQPPLSRKIKSLEDRLGVGLFVRHSYGLELTQEGKDVLEIISPLLTLRDEVQARLERLANKKSRVIGLSTAFEQATYEPVMKLVNSVFDGKIIIKRASSIHLAKDVAKGNLLAAWVALPLQKSNLSVVDVHYAESMLAVVPEQWLINDTDIYLRDLNGRPFFWFPAHRNPFWHAYMKSIFDAIGFKTNFLEEPLEHDVLLARIACGDAFALMPQSFSAIQRKGIKFIGVKDIPPLAMGIIYQNEDGENLAYKFIEMNNLGNFE